MAVAAAARRQEVKQLTYAWEGVDRSNRTMRGEMRAASTTVVSTALRRQGIKPLRIKQVRLRGGGKIKEKDIALFTRQMATMMRAGVPLLQSFDIVARGHSNPRVSRLLLDIKSDIETGSSLNQAFRKHPAHFDALYCNLISAGESAGVLEVVLERLASYKEKILAIKSKIKSAMFYPAAIVVVAIVVVAVIMLYVIPAFKKVFTSFGADLPAPTLVVISISDFMIKYAWLMGLIIVGAVTGLLLFFKRSAKFRMVIDRVILRIPVLGDVIRKATLARWSRTLSTMFAAGVPLVEAMDSVAGAAGNYVYHDATKKIQSEISTGVSLTSALQNRGSIFPNLVVQMTQIGEESGSLDTMLSKVADFYEQEVDDAVAALSSLMEPILMVVLGVVIGGLVIAMYLPIFKLGAVI